MAVIYKTTNKLNGKYYIGVSNGRNSNYKGSGTALHSAMRKYGRENFIRETLEVFDTIQEAFGREAEIVTKEFVANPNTYNLKVGGKGGIGQKKTASHRAKLSKAITNKFETDSKYASNVGRNAIIEADKLIELVEEKGIVQAAEDLGLNYDTFRARYYRIRNK